MPQTIDPSRLVRRRWHVKLIGGDLPCVLPPLVLGFKTTRILGRSVTQFPLINSVNIVGPASRLRTSLLQLNGLSTTPITRSRHRTWPSA
jgi:hypothetical protein